jgi:hypothetical protein
MRKLAVRELAQPSYVGDAWENSRNSRNSQDPIAKSMPGTNGTSVAQSLARWREREGALQQSVIEIADGLKDAASVADLAEDVADAGRI